MPKRISGKSHELEEPFDCDAVCRRRNGDGQFDDGSRAARGCTRTDLPAVGWDVSPGLLRRGHMGRRPIFGVKEEDGFKVRNPSKPLERLSDGCPGGWYRSPFVWSLGPYLRTRIESGQRVHNPLLQRCEDEFVLQCEQLFVLEEDRAAAYRMEQMTR